MQKISGQTLMLAIQAVDAKIRALHTVPDGADHNEVALADAEEMLVSYQDAAEELRAAYEIARLMVSNLPPYATLVRSN